MNDVMITGRISQEAVQADVARASSATLAALGSEEQRKLVEAIRRYPALLKLPRYVELVMPLRAAVENEDLTAEDRAALTAALRQGLDDYRAEAR